MGRSGEMPAASWRRLLTGAAGSSGRHAGGQFEHDPRAGRRLPAARPAGPPPDRSPPGTRPRRAPRPARGGERAPAPSRASGPGGQPRVVVGHVVHEATAGARRGRPSHRQHDERLAVVDVGVRRRGDHHRRSRGPRAVRSPPAPSRAGWGGAPGPGRAGDPGGRTVARRVQADEAADQPATRAGQRPQHGRDPPVHVQPHQPHPGRQLLLGRQPGSRPAQDAQPMTVRRQRGGAVAGTGNRTRTGSRRRW